MKISLHPNAIQNLEEKTNNLINYVSKIKVPEKIPTENNELYVSATLTRNDIIGDIRPILKNLAGEELGKVFIYDKEQYGLVDNGYKEFILVVQSIIKNKDIAKNLSFEFLKDCLFEWIKNVCVNGKTIEFIEYLLKSSEEAVVEYQIYIPVPYTQISKNFNFGNIEFVTLTEKIIEEWFVKCNHLGEQSEEDKKSTEDLKLKIKKDIKDIRSVFTNA